MDKRSADKMALTDKEINTIKQKIHEALRGQRKPWSKGPDTSRDDSRGRHFLHADPIEVLGQDKVSKAQVGSVYQGSLVAQGSLAAPSQGFAHEIWVAVWI